MQSIRVNISEQDSNAVHNAHTDYIAYVEMLGYILDHHPNLESSPLFEEKWNICLDLYKQAELLKQEMELKYKPNDGVPYTNYTFDFATDSMIFEVRDLGETNL